MESKNYYLSAGEVSIYLELSPGFRIAFTKKPNWFHRQMIKFVFGWIWIDGKL